MHSTDQDRRRTTHRVNGRFQTPTEQKLLEWRRRTGEEQGRGGRDGSRKFSSSLEVTAESGAAVAGLMRGKSADSQADVLPGSQREHCSGLELASLSPRLKTKARRLRFKSESIDARRPPRRGMAVRANAFRAFFEGGTPGRGIAERG